MSSIFLNKKSVEKCYLFCFVISNFHFGKLMTLNLKIHLMKMFKRFFNGINYFYVIELQLLELK